MAAYYVVSDALANVAKHAKASEVNVEVDATGGWLRLSIRDDGVGGADLRKGSGLIGLEDRVEALGGMIRITSPPVGSRRAAARCQARGGLGVEIGSRRQPVGDSRPESEVFVMTALPYPPGRLLSIEDYLALGEDEHVRYELEEGRLLVSPSPSPDHMDLIIELVLQLRSQLPANLRLVPDVDFDLQLAPRGQPGSSRRPDLVIVPDVAMRRVRREGGMLRAEEVLVVVEVASPGSKKIDHVIKRDKYADAGVPRYWIIDTDEPLTLIDCQLADGLGYQDAGAVTGTFSTEITNRAGTLRYSVRLDLDQLLYP